MVGPALPSTFTAHISQHVRVEKQRETIIQPRSWLRVELLRKKRKKNQPEPFWKMYQMPSEEQRKER